MSTWHTIVINKETQLELGYAYLTEAEIADIKSRMPFETPFVAGVKTMYGSYTKTDHPNGRFRMVDPEAVERCAARRRQKKAEEFKQALETLEAIQNYHYIAPPVIELTRRVEKKSLIKRTYNNICRILKGE